MDQLKDCLSNYIPNNCEMPINTGLIDQYIRQQFTTDPRQVAVFVLAQVTSSPRYPMLKSYLNQLLVNAFLHPIP
jgi:hypothetical protein